MATITPEQLEKVVGDHDGREVSIEQYPSWLYANQRKCERPAEVPTYFGFINRESSSDNGFNF
ncbi:hypothetical protein L3V79_05865 [Thiotrichales bacterium 19S9-12]|nr:hypothetical protein [Thiotrichales bacterium 19S9-11]MCF6811885.1 hypothetical protein [Thiotrichales bacterium 19S9-12]